MGVFYIALVTFTFQREIDMGVFYIALVTFTCQREIDMGVFYIVMFPVAKIVWRRKYI